ncbi:hypothetical protein [Emticicia oligotrophica]|uniref:hypothetical protein n=1 Tax=Emticicia oligotrophica TaxID=312279 RepID=UPI00273BC879|nr:hypothetical protein [Emticicia oligotrophica]
MKSLSSFSDSSMTRSEMKTVKGGGAICIGTWTNSSGDSFSWGMSCTGAYASISSCITKINSKVGAKSSGSYTCSLV